MAGIYYSVGTGPGDKKLLTLKAVEVITSSDIIILPDSGSGENAVKKIIDEYIKDKTIIYCDMPMIRDKEKLRRIHESHAHNIAKLLDEGKNVAFPTLGDPGIYSTAMYIHQLLGDMGYKTEVVPGVPSFCAAAAALGETLCEGSQMLHIIPASYGDVEYAINLPGNKVLMKSGKSIKDVIEKADHLSVRAVERLGMENEKIHYDTTTLDENSSYFTVLIAKEIKK